MFIYSYINIIMMGKMWDWMKMSVSGKEWKQRQEVLEESFDRVDAIKTLKDFGIISLHDYWILIGNYKIVV